MQQDHASAEASLPVATVQVTLAYRPERAAATLLELRSPSSAVLLDAGPDYGTADFWRTSPVLPNGWALLGELDKFIGISRQRIARITAGSEAGVLKVFVVGAPGELVHMTAASKSVGASNSHANWKLCVIDVRVGSEGTAEFMLPGSGGCNKS